MYTKKRQEALDKLRKVLIEECSDRTVSVALLLKGEGWEITRKERVDKVPKEERGKYINLNNEVIR